MESRQPPGLALFEPREGVPVLAAYREVLPGEDTDLLHAWCEHCDKLHIHGGEGKTPLNDDTHRRPHCRSDHSPYKRSGYYLREVGPKPNNWQRFANPRKRLTR